MSKATRPKRAHLERDLIATEQAYVLACRERDAAIRERDAWKAVAEARRPPWHHRITGPVSDWLDELAKGLGL